MKRIAAVLFVLTLGVLLTGYGGPWPDPEAPGYSHGVAGSVASDETLAALGALLFPRKLPATATVYYVSSEADGWYPQGTLKPGGTQTDPLRTMTDVHSIMRTAEGAQVYLFDPPDTFSVSTAAAADYGFVNEPDSGGCGGTGEVCWVFASADMTGNLKPTWECTSTEANPPADDGFITNDTGDWMAFANIRFRCPTLPNEDLKPIFYNDGLMLLANVHFDQLVGTGNVAFQGVAGSQTVGVNVTGVTDDGHDWDALCVGADDPYECCTATPDCDGSNPHFFDIDGGEHIFIGGDFLYDQRQDGANLPIVSFANLSGGDTWIIDTRFRMIESADNQDTLKRAIVLEGDADLFLSHGLVSADRIGTPTATTDDNSAIHFTGADAGQDADIRIYRQTINGLERVWDWPDLDASTTDSVWMRCGKIDEQDVGKNSNCYDVYAAAGGFSDAELSLDVQLSLFDDECGNKQFHWQGVDYSEIADFRANAADAITSYFGNAHHTTVGTEGSRDCGGVANGICHPANMRQTGQCGGTDATDCAERCTLSLVETLPFTVPDFFLGDGGAFSRFSFNPNGDQNFGGD